MGERGPKPKRKNPIVWSCNVAYATGLFATDGCLSPDGRHIDFTSKDIEQLENFKKCFDLATPISYKMSGYTGKPISRIQFSDIVLYRFFQSIGFTPAKTKTIEELSIPQRYFFDFLRGHHDGDGCFYSYWDPRWKSSFMYYVCFVSASPSHIKWIRTRLNALLKIKGSLVTGKQTSVYQLKYAKKESLQILHKMYHVRTATHLKRKRLKIEKALSIVGEHL